MFTLRRRRASGWLGSNVTLEPREPIVVSRKRRRQDLDRDLTLQLGIGGPIHLSHPAFADLLGDFVDADSGTTSETQTAGSING